MTREHDVPGIELLADTRPAATRHRAAAVVIAVLTLLLTTLSSAPDAEASNTSVRSDPGPRLGVSAGTVATALSCPRAAGRRTPVLLVHGTSTTPEISWSTGLQPLLTRLGYTVCTVRLPANAMGDVDVASRYVVGSIRSMTKRFHQPVNLIGHSQGGMLLRWVLKWWPDMRSLVGDVISLSPSNHGTPLGAALCTAVCPASVWQQSPGSHFLTALNSGDDTPGRYELSVVYSDTDTTVPPPSPVIIGDADDTNTSVQSICPGREVSHTQMQYDAISVAMVLDALTHPGPARPTRISRSLCSRTYAAGIDEQAADQQQREGDAFSLMAIATSKQLLAEPTLAPFATRPPPKPHASLLLHKSRTARGVSLTLRAVGVNGSDQWALPFATFEVAGRRITADHTGRATVRLSRLEQHVTIGLRARGLAPVTRRLR